MRLYGTFNGTLVVAGLAIIFTLLAPNIFAFFTIITLTQVIGLSILALSLALVWGFGGILCFGQSAFFGIGAYAYSVAAVNIGGSTGAIFIAILAAAAFAAILGYFVFYGKVSDVYLAVITLTVSLILYSLMRRTSGPEYKIGNALLGGFNGTGWRCHAVSNADFLCLYGSINYCLCIHGLACHNKIWPRMRIYPRK